MSSKRRKKTSPGPIITESVSPQVEETTVVEETSCEKKEESGKDFLSPTRNPVNPRRLRSVEEQELPQPTEEVFVR